MKFSLLVLTSVVSVSISAQPLYLCKQGSAERKVEVVYKSSGARTPCEVKYTKGTNVTLPWNARHQEGYCEIKAKQLVKKLEGYGWRCSEKPLKSQ